MKYVAVGVVLMLIVAFNNCGGGGTLTIERNSSSSVLQVQQPPPGPYATQPDATNSMADVKPLNGACPANFGSYDMLSMTPAIDGSNWNHSVCVKPFMANTTSVISDVELVAGSVCGADQELAVTIPYNTDSSVQRFAMAYSICVKRATLPVTESFVTYFYLSSAGAACRAGDIARGSAMFCTTPNAVGECQNPVVVQFCKSVQ